MEEYMSDMNYGNEVDNAADFLASLNGDCKSRSPQWVEDTLKNNNKAIIVDIRSREDYCKSRISGSINIPLEELGKHYNVISDIDSSIIVMCRGGIRSSYGVMFFSLAGFKDVHQLEGGMNAWKKEKKDVEGEGCSPSAIAS